MGDVTVIDPRSVAVPVSLTTATTLPAAWYHDDAHHRRELDAIFRQGWSCVGVTDDVARARQLPGDHQRHRPAAPPDP